MGQGSSPCPSGHFLAADLVELPTHLFPHPSSEVLGGLNVMSVRRAWHAGSAHECRTLVHGVTVGLDLQSAPPCTPRDQAPFLLSSLWPDSQEPALGGQEEGWWAGPAWRPGLPCPLPAR